MSPASFEQPNNQKEKPDENPVEKEANFEGNESLVLISRLKHPNIAKQIVEVHYRQKLEQYNFYQDETWERHIPKGWTGEEPMQLLKGEESGEIISAGDLQAKLELLKPDKDDIRRALEQNIQKVSKKTDIDYTTAAPNADVIPINWEVSWTGEKATTKQMSIVEAHEKGHLIRNYDESTDKLRAGFDISQVEMDEASLAALERNLENPANQFVETDEEIDSEEFRDGYLHNYVFTGDEIAERMSQLKNYFGFKGDEMFTKEHLRYAKEHYVRDTGLDHNMKLFLQGITKDTEDTFLELINSYGI
jgi:hypothetical protein